MFFHVFMASSFTYTLQSSLGQSPRMVPAGTPLKHSFETLRRNSDPMLSESVAEEVTPVKSELIAS
jgi:hypothetical protein